MYIYIYKYMCIYIYKHMNLWTKTCVDRNMYPGTAVAEYPLNGADASRGGDRNLEIDLQHIQKGRQAL